MDAYPGHILHGHVNGIQAGSGARFSLLPPENATGNFVKIVQRMPDLSFSMNRSMAAMSLVRGCASNQP